MIVAMTAALKAEQAIDSLESTQMMMVAASLSDGASNEPCRNDGLEVRLVVFEVSADGAVPVDFREVSGTMGTDPVEMLTQGLLDREAETVEGRVDDLANEFAAASRRSAGRVAVISRSARTRVGSDSISPLSCGSSTNFGRPITPMASLTTRRRTSSGRDGEGLQASEAGGGGLTVSARRHRPHKCSWRS
jgi:hypothetical protein